MNKKDTAEMSTQDKVKEITDKIEQGVKDVFTSDKFMEYLNTLSKFHHYSLNNTILIHTQLPGATLVAGYKKWQKEFDRHVKPGAKSIRILAPSYFKTKVKKDKKDRETGLPIIGVDGKPESEVVEVQIPSYRAVPVFDVSQTEGKEMPLDKFCPDLTGNVEDYENFVRAIKETSQVPISFEDIEGGAKGYYSLTDKRIAIQEGMSQSHTIKTLVHELTHSMLHADNLNASPEDKKDRNTMEVEAEATAYTVCQRFGIETSGYSFDYIAMWSSGREVEELKASLDIIRETASKIITGIEARLLEIERENENSVTDERTASQDVIGRFEDAGVPFIDMDFLDANQVEETLRGVADALDYFSLPLSSIERVCGVEWTDRNNIAAMNGDRHLQLSNRFYAPGIGHRDGELYATGAHEVGGYLIARKLIDQSFPDQSDGIKNGMWYRGEIETAILNEAEARYGKNASITGYGSMRANEKIAEAVADVVAYKSGNEYNQVIVDIIKEHLDNPEKEYMMKKERKKSRGR